MGAQGHGRCRCIPILYTGRTLPLVAPGCSAGGHAGLPLLRRSDRSFGEVPARIDFDEPAAPRSVAPADDHWPGRPHPGHHSRDGPVGIQRPSLGWHHVLSCLPIRRAGMPRAIHTRGPHRASWLGATLFGAGYAALVFSRPMDQPPRVYLPTDQFLMASRPWFPPIPKSISASNAPSWRPWNSRSRCGSPMRRRWTTC